MISKMPKEWVCPSCAEESYTLPKFSASSECLAKISTTAKTLPPPSHAGENTSQIPSDRMHSHPRAKESRKSEKQRSGRVAPKHSATATAQAVFVLTAANAAAASRTRAAEAQTEAAAAANAANALPPAVIAPAQCSLKQPSHPSGTSQPT